MSSPTPPLTPGEGANESEPLTDEELAGWCNAVRSVQLKGTKADVSKMSDAERFLATIDAKDAEIARLTEQRRNLHRDELRANQREGE